MNEIHFDPQKLTKRELSTYNAMTTAEKKSFEKTWIDLQKNKLRLEQKIHARKERDLREKKTLAEKERKERNHRLIVRGAILEANIKAPLDFSDQEIKEIVEYTFQSEFMRKFIEKVRNRHHESSENKLKYKL